jgi:hypothetical protein
MESPSAKQPAPKRSRNRKEQWANAPITNANVDGNDKASDPVLHSALTSFQHKADIFTQINASADHLKVGRNHEQVFHRTTVEDQAKVIRMRINRWMARLGFTRDWRSLSCIASRLDCITQSGWKSWNTYTSRERSLTPSSIASSSAAAPSAERLALMEKRAAIFEDKEDDDLTAKDKAVYKYRAERKRQWNSFSGSTTLSELQYNEQYDEEQLAGVKKSEPCKPQ